MTGKNDLAAALDAWREALGGGHVRLPVPENDCWREGLRTFGASVRVAARLLPGTAAEVAHCLAIATRHGIGIHPVSRGANWGLGSRAPLRDGDAVLDLSRLTGIDGLDTRHGRVRIEPGVTFLQLHARLKDRVPDYFLPTIGGPVTASVLANALDRGDAMFCDRWSSLSDLQVALADGRLVDTGHMPQSALCGLGIAPAGALLDGIFSQSNMGVVTGAWLRLEPVPNSVSGWVARIGTREGLPAFIDAWRDLQRAGTLRDRSLTLWNGIKRLAREGPRHRHDPDRLARAQLDDWHCSGFITAESPDILTLREGLIEQRLGSRALSAGCYPLRSGGVWQSGASDIFATPSQANLRTVYWRERMLPEPDAMDPDRDHCGLIWLCVALPMEGAAILDFAERCHARLARAGMDLNFAVEAASFRVALCYITLSHARSEAADRAALDAYENLMALCLDLGHAPYRLANGAPLPERLRATPRNDSLRRIRAALDPAGILSAGRAGI